MMSHLSSSRTIVLMLVLLLIASCTTPSASTDPFAGLTEWDLVLIGDSSLWDVGEPYARLIERDRGVKVNLHDEWQAGLGAATILNALRGDFEDSFNRRKWPQLVQDAEVLVLFGNPLFSDLDPALLTSLYSCVNSVAPPAPSEEPASGSDTGACSAIGYGPYRQDMDAIVDEIARLRAGRPLILRMVDIYNPLIGDWREESFEGECRACWEGMSAAVRGVAVEHGVQFVSAYDAFNGLNHDEDPIAKGYMRDGEHPSQAGAQFYAELLLSSGYNTWVAQRP